MTPERLAEIEEKIAGLRTVGNTPGANTEREDFLAVEVPELVAALKEAQAPAEEPDAKPKKAAKKS